MSSNVSTLGAESTVRMHAKTSDATSTTRRDTGVQAHAPCLTMRSASEERKGVPSRLIDSRDDALSRRERTEVRVSGGARWSRTREVKWKAGTTIKRAGSLKPANSSISIQERSTLALKTHVSEVDVLEVDVQLSMMVRNPVGNSWLAAAAGVGLRRHSQRNGQ